MNATTYIPAPALRPFIRHYMVMESPEDQVNRILPDTALVMAFRYKGQVSFVSDGDPQNLSLSMISGLRKSNRLIRYARGTGNILVIFKEAGAHAVIKEPLNELYDQTATLNNFSGYGNLSFIEEQLAAADTTEQRIRLLDHFLSCRLYHQKPDLLVLAAMQKIRLVNGVLRIKDLVSTLCLSQDAFEKRFRRVAGVTPKQFAGILRMKSIIDAGLKKQDLAETAFNAGYFDQPHFNKDFKLFTGQTPTDFLKSPVFW